MVQAPARYITIRAAGDVRVFGRSGDRSGLYAYLHRGSAGTYRLAIAVVEGAVSAPV